MRRIVHKKTPATVSTGSWQKDYPSRFEAAMAARKAVNEGEPWANVSSGGVLVARFERHRGYAVSVYSQF